MYFNVNEFEVGVNDDIFSGSEHEKVYITKQNILITYSTYTISWLLLKSIICT